MFHSLTTLFRSRAKALKAARPASRTRLSLECLEARITPSTTISHSSHVHVTDVTIVAVVDSYNHVSVSGSHDIVLVGDIF